MDTVNYILTAVICSCEGGLDAHANTERGNILSSEGETLVGSQVVGNPSLIRLWKSSRLSRHITVLSADAFEPAKPLYNTRTLGGGHALRSGERAVAGLLRRDRGAWR